MLRILTFSLAVLAFAVPAAAKTVFPPGLQVGLTPAGDLAANPRTGGFEDPDRKVVVAIAQLPAAAFPELEKSITDKLPAGISDVRQQPFKFAGGSGYLVSGRSSDGNGPFKRWLMLAKATAGESAFVAVVNVTVPDAARSVYTDEAVQNMLASIVFRPPPIAEQLGLLPFKLTDLAGFRVIQVMPGGVVVLTDGPADDISHQPYIVVSIARGDADQADDRARFARDLLSSLPLGQLTVRSAEDMRIGGRPGFEIRADATSNGGEPVSLVQWVRFNGGSFIRMVAVGDRQKWDSLFDRLRHVRDGIALR